MCNLLLLIIFSFLVNVKSLDSATIINDVCVPPQIADLENYLQRFTTPEITEFNTLSVSNAAIDQGNDFQKTPFGIFPVDWKRLINLHDHLPPDSEIKSKLLTLCKLLMLAYDEVQNSARNNSGNGLTTSETRDSENDENNKKTLSLSTQSTGQRMPRSTEVLLGGEKNEKITTVETSAPLDRNSITTSGNSVKKSSAGNYNNDTTNFYVKAKFPNAESTTFSFTDKSEIDTTSINEEPKTKTTITTNFQKNNDEQIATTVAFDKSSENFGTTIKPTKPIVSDEDELDVSIPKIDELDFSYTIGTSTVIEDFDSTSTKFLPKGTKDFNLESTSQGSTENSITTRETNLMEKSSDIKTDEIFDTTTTTYSTIGSEISDTVISYVISGSTETPNNGEKMLKQTTSVAVPKVTMEGTSNLNIAKNAVSKVPIGIQEKYPQEEIEGSNHLVKNHIRDFPQQFSSQRKSDLNNNKKYQEPTANLIDRNTQILPGGSSGQKNELERTKESRPGQLPFFVPFYNHPEAEFEFHRRSKKPQRNEITAGFSKRAEHNTELEKLYRWFYRQGQEYVQPMQLNVQSYPNAPFLGEIKCKNMQVIG